MRHQPLSVMRVEEDGSLSEYADLSQLSIDDCNDMVVDGAGRCYVGDCGWNFWAGGEKKDGPLIKVDTDGKAEVK